MQLALFVVDVQHGSTDFSDSHPPQVEHRSAILHKECVCCRQLYKMPILVGIAHLLKWELHFGTRLSFGTDVAALELDQKKLVCWALAVAHADDVDGSADAPCGVGTDALAQHGHQSVPRKRVETDLAEDQLLCRAAIRLGLVRKSGHLTVDGGAAPRTISAKEQLAVPAPEPRTWKCRRVEV